MLEVGSSFDGFILIDKPKGQTSFDCIRDIKRAAGRKIKIGHAGTLDKFATGLLIVGVGKGTKLMGNMLGQSKTYIATGKFGELTDTYDNTGEIKLTCNKVITEFALKAAIKSFGHGYDQVPPICSALKHEGQRLSDLWRQGEYSLTELEKIAEDKKRFINLYSFELVSFDFPFFTINVHCSSGTYVRALINDIAKKLDTCATTHELRRATIGNFDVKDATCLAKLDSDAALDDKLISISKLQSMINI